jgi:hypothetical protein
MDISTSRRIVYRAVAAILSRGGSPQRDVGPGAILGHLMLLAGLVSDYISITYQAGKSQSQPDSVVALSGVL